MNVDTSGTAAVGEMHKELLFLGIQVRGDAEFNYARTSTMKYCYILNS